MESNHIARERKQTFVGFENSKYADGSYFDKYITGEFVPKSDRVKELFAEHFIPSGEDWAKLRDAVMTDGLYHQNRLAVAPNGSISYINDVSASLHPITQRIEERQEKKLVRFITQLLVYLQILFLITLLLMIWICEKSLMFMLRRLNTLTKDCH